ncbi:hypothetical protein LTR35_016514 [Friedmanniomyces endolithicus]|uniref:Uncharacterized protein n=1 Tax=Friedmanniomyces endolithicus TaxID=329885 RepID=A0AAN6F8P6_9PEZI|nr:hypothetical protein LTR35_016514 [Friedmanniomyces endolithicus]KAK0273786.1 hypothetical protein LTS00_015636 [Friedmanniomyces endolithicus]KAK0306258.1 hypothetical protein LTR82_016473 [Friedmanniomyces endolithicus]KAK0977997.1 hypothetical protein LTR54_016022 [Friedmanniomyces endolithicus]KAK1060444.1 hypothetical protein LTR74_011885 [Friedmanniomyces endolithicus]
MGKDSKKKKNKSTVKDYADDLDPNVMTGGWDPEGTWHRIHGDGKSRSGGKWHMETLKSKNTSKDEDEDNSKYYARLKEDSRNVLATFGPWSTEPSFATIVNAVKAWAK